MKLVRRAGSTSARRALVERTTSARRAGLMSWLSGHLNGVILQTFTKLLYELTTSARRASSWSHLVETASSCKRGITVAVTFGCFAVYLSYIKSPVTKPKTRLGLRHKKITFTGFIYLYMYTHCYCVQSTNQRVVMILVTTNRPGARKPGQTCQAKTRSGSTR